MVTVHEFLSRLVADAHARSVFEADPRGALEQAGLGVMSNAELVQASSLMLDYTPIEVLEDYVRVLPASLVVLGGGYEHVALTYPTPLVASDPDHDQETDLPSLNDFTSTADPAELLGPSEGSNADGSETSSESSESQTAQGSNNTIGSGNELQVDQLVGNVNAAGVAGDINGVQDTGDANLGNIASNGVTDAVGGIQGGDTMGQLGDIAGAGDITGGLSDLGGVTPEAGDVTGALPVEAPQDLAANTMAPVTGPGPIGAAEGPIGTADDTIGDLTSGAQDLGGLGL